MITLRRTKYSDKESSTFKPQLTSLVDVMTILLVFLIKSFSAEGNIITPSSDLALPVSNSKTPARSFNSLKITKEYIMSDKQVIVNVASFKESDSLEIPELRAWIRHTKSLDSTMSKELMIQSDKDISFDIIKKVMYTCSKSGTSDFTILVVREG